MDQDAEFLRRLNETFRTEAREHLDMLARGLAEWQGDPGDERVRELVESLYRETHTLKGAARSVDRRDLEALCHPLEGLFRALKGGELTWSPELGELLRETLEGLEDAVLEEASASTSGLSSRLAAALNGSASPPLKPETSPEPVSTARPLSETPPLADTIRIATAKLDPILLQAEELVPLQVGAQQRLNEWRNLLAKATGVTPEWRAQAARVLQAGEREYRAQRRLIEEHLEAAKELLVLPASLLTEGLPKLVRDLAADRGKEAELVVRGHEVQIDKRLLEELKAPLVHLLRNAVDHGIEEPQARVALKKRRKGSLALEFSLKDGRSWEIVVRDDGAGLNRERLVRGAVDGGFITAEASGTLDLDQSAELAFLSGLSTKAQVDEVSGRGLGLAIVREKVARLGGSVTLRSQPGEGTEFTLQVPLALSTLRCVFVRVGDQRYAIPSADVERVLRPSPSDFGTDATLRFGGEVLARKTLASVLGVVSNQDPAFAVVLSRGERKSALLVDEVLEEQWVLVKALGHPLMRVRNIAGATILGTGKVAAVLQTVDLLEPSAAVHEGPARDLPWVLVAEDSATSREWIKSLLESDYRVVTAPDGLAAWNWLKMRAVDVVISDVDMPNMTGLELTARIRREPGLKHLPVILVTSLESPSDHENGLRAGADAYLTKGVFDQAALRAAVARFVRGPR